MSTLSQVHSRQIVHKDINPANIVFNPDTREVKLIDFGLANVLPQETTSFVSPNLLEGTLPYLSPEQTGRMNRPVDYRSDFYALGVTFYELLTGQLPFRANDALEWVHHHVASVPVSPSAVSADVPEAIAQIILKLMAKTAEGRYQSAVGLKADLEHCQAQWQAQQRIPVFPLAQCDRLSRFQLSQDLYGREKDIALLTQVFDQVSRVPPQHPVEPASEMPSEYGWQLVLISGYSGVGKSALVRELYRPLGQALGRTVGRTEGGDEQGHFVTGKHDQTQEKGSSPVPYQAFSQAFNQFCRYLLTESAEQLNYWRNTILQAVKTNGRLLTDIIPDLALVIGPQPPVPEATTAEAQNRFQRVFYNFVRSLASSAHPLVLFIDDLQWADSASLQLLQSLFDRPIDDGKAAQGLMLIGAYRNNEVDAAHPLMHAITALAEKGIEPTTIELDNLPVDAVNAWISESLDCLPEQSRPLATLVHQKTLGNAFFTAEFLKTLYSGNLLKMVEDAKEQTAQWWWDIDQIRLQNITDNVVELMTQKLVDLPSITTLALQLAACWGSQFSLESLALVTQQPELELLQSLMPAIQSGFLLPLDSRYKLLLEGDNPSDVEFCFQHDRVQQAAYVLISSEKVAQLHWQIGQALWIKENEETELEEGAERLKGEMFFEMVNHLNLGRTHIARAPSPVQLVTLNLHAGYRALAKNAYESAQAYFDMGLQQLATEDEYALTMSLLLGAAKATCSLGQWVPMAKRIEQVVKVSHSVLDAVPAYELKIEAAHAKNQLADGIEITLETLKSLGFEFPSYPEPAVIGEALTQTAQSVAQYSLDDLLALPEMRSPTALAVMRLINAIITPCFSARPTLLPVVVTAQIRLAIAQGNTPDAAYAYGIYGLILSGIVGDFASSYTMGQLSRQLLIKYRESGRSEPLRARTQHVLYAFIDHWHEPLTLSRPKLLANYQLGLDTGDLEYAVLSAHVYCLNGLLTGEPLQGLAKEMALYSDVMRQLKRTTTLNFQTVWHQAVLNLLGESPRATQLQGSVYDEATQLPVHHERQDATALLIVYWHKAVLCYWFGEGEAALRHIQQSADYLQGVPGLPIVPVWHFYNALIHLGQYKCIDVSQQADVWLQVEQSRSHLHTWSALADNSHTHKLALIDAEIARVTSQVTEAMDYYDAAIDAAQALGYVHEQALANELAASFYQKKGNQKIARLYFKEAISAYTRWGATAKLKDLSARYPTLAPPQVQSIPTHLTRWNSTETDSTQLDMVSVLKASQALASDIQLNKLLVQLMTLALQNAGAEKGCLLTLEKENWFVAALAAIPQDITVHNPSIALSNQAPVGLLNYVKRTQESVVLSEAKRDRIFGHDPYMQQNKPLSVLCVPLLNQGKLNGVIYLENNLLTNAFTRDRLAVLQLLSAQAAISLENAQLYTQLKHYSQTLEEKVAERTTELAEANQQLQHQATVDSLTQLTNRRGFDSVLQSNWLRLARGQQSLALILCDVDYFKLYNDCYGHLQGDDCLRCIAKILGDTAQREGDVAARYGGEEFAVLLPNTPLRDAIALAERVRSQVEFLQLPHNGSPVSQYVTLSLGVASCVPSPSAASEQLIAAADKALYLAKSKGRNGFCVA
ncbi:MAG: diguanylate cyclase [Cyanobacteria bacterium J06560_2]